MVICLNRVAKWAIFVSNRVRVYSVKTSATQPKLPWGVRIPPLLDSGNLPPILTINTLLGFPLPTAFIAEIRK